MSNRIFCEVREGVVVHTAVSKLLAEDVKLLAWTGVCVEEMWPSASKVDTALRFNLYLLANLAKDRPCYGQVAKLTRTGTYGRNEQLESS